MAKSRRRDAAGMAEFTNLANLDVEKRTAWRAKKAAEHIEHKNSEDKEWQEELVEFGGKEKERRARVAALYSDLRMAYDKGDLSERQIRDYLEDFPSSSEYRAFEELFEAISEGRAKKEGESLQAEAKEEIKFLKRRALSGEEKRLQERNKILRGAIGERLGLTGALPKFSETEEENFKFEEWKRALLREYAEGNIDDDDINNFFEYYSKEKREVYNKLAKEESIRMKKEEISANRLNREEVEEMMMRGLGFKEELIKDIPTKEGKALFEEMLDDQIEIFKGVMLDTVSRADYEKKIQEAGGDRERAEKELIAEEAKKFLAMRELFTHGSTGYDKEKGQIVLRRFSDLDGKCAIALLGKAGIDISKVGYLTPGEKRQGQITIDSGNADGLVSDSVETVDPKTGERKVEVTTVLDHHGPYSDRGTSATKSVYKVLTELGLLKFEDEKDRKNYEKAVEWVTQTDNFSFPNMEKYFQTSDRRMIGFLKSHFITLNNLLNFADSGKEITDLLDEKDLRRFGLVRDIYKKKKFVKTIDHTAERREVIKKTLESVAELEGEKWVVKTEDGKRFLVDTQDKIGGEGQWAAASRGFDGVIRYTPETHNFFVALNKGTFDKKTFAGLSQGKLVRGSVFIKLAGGEKLTVTLGDLVGRLAPKFEPEKETGLDKFLETEPRRIRTIVSQANKKWWWANTPNGEKIIVFDRDIPEGFKSGQEAYIRLTSSRPQEADDEQKREYNISKFYVGRLESDEIILPKKPAEKKEPAKIEVEPAKLEIVPEAKNSPKPKIEIQSPVSKVEKRRTPEETREIERNITWGRAGYMRGAFFKVMESFSNNTFWRKKSKKERVEAARSLVEKLTQDWEKEERKKYGL
jgi:hypothetical protein